MNSGRVSSPWYRGSVKLPAVNWAAIYGAVMAGEGRPGTSAELAGAVRAGCGRHVTA
ncbi:hypothetical protein [Escherichia coli]|uniref:hypothetical protein n=1 Tax=Escherichia coli TaxID=562 RepID=UPI002FCD691E